MDKTSSVATGSATAAAAALAPLVDWIANGRLKWDMPSPVVLIFSAAAVTIGHFIVNIVNSRNLLNAPQSGSAPTVVTKEGGYMRLAILPLLSIFAIAASMLVGCTTTAGTAQLTPAQVVAQVCPAVQITMTSLAALEDLPVSAIADLAKAAPVVQVVCSPNATIDLSSLQAMSSTAFPALLRIADAAGLSPAEHDRIVLGLTVSQIAIDGALMAAGKASIPAAP